MTRDKDGNIHIGQDYWVTPQIFMSMQAAAARQQATIAHRLNHGQIINYSAQDEIRIVQPQTATCAYCRSKKFQRVCQGCGASESL